MFLDVTTSLHPFPIPVWDGMTLVVGFRPQKWVGVWRRFTCVELLFHTVELSNPCTLYTCTNAVTTYLTNHNIRPTLFLCNAIVHSDSPTVLIDQMTTLYNGSRTSRKGAILGGCPICSVTLTTPPHPCRCSSPRNCFASMKVSRRAIFAVLLSHF